MAAAAALIVVAFTRPDGTALGSVTQAGTGSVAYNTTSDQRLKEDKGLLTSTQEVLAPPECSNFLWKDGEESGCWTLRPRKSPPSICRALCRVSKARDDPKTEALAGELYGSDSLFARCVARDQEKRIAALRGFKAGCSGDSMRLTGWFGLCAFLVTSKCLGADPLLDQWGAPNGNFLFQGGRISNRYVLGWQRPAANKRVVLQVSESGGECFALDS